MNIEQALIKEVTLTSNLRIFNSNDWSLLLHMYRCEIWNDSFKNPSTCSPIEIKIALKFLNLNGLSYYIRLLLCLRKLSNNISK